MFTGTLSDRCASPSFEKGSYTLISMKSTEGTYTSAPGSITVAVIAGGQSSRMGTDKSFIELAGKPMIEHVLKKVSDLGDRIIIISNNPEMYQHLELPTYPDIIPGKGPLGGLYTALTRSSTSHLLLVACDMPWLNRPLLNYMISIREQADAIVPRWTKHPEPLHAVYSRDCLPAIENRLSAGELKMISFYELIKVHFVEKSKLIQFDPRGRSFANVNTPEDLEQASTRDGLS